MLTACGPCIALDSEDNTPAELEELLYWEISEDSKLRWIHCQSTKEVIHRKLVIDRNLVFPRELNFLEQVLQGDRDAMPLVEAWCTHHLHHHSQSRCCYSTLCHYSHRLARASLECHVWNPWQWRERTTARAQSLELWRSCHSRTRLFSPVESSWACRCSLPPIGKPLT